MYATVDAHMKLVNYQAARSTSSSDSLMSHMRRVISSHTARFVLVICMTQTPTTDSQGVQSIFKFSTIDEVLKRANDSKYGLAAGVFSQNIDTINTLSRGLKAGSVWVNCYNKFASAAPFGGFKTSGIGRDKGEAALDLYTETSVALLECSDKSSSSSSKSGVHCSSSSSSDSVSVMFEENAACSALLVYSDTKANCKCNTIWGFKASVIAREKEEDASELYTETKCVQRANNISGNNSSGNNSCSTFHAECTHHVADARAVLGAFENVFIVDCVCAVLLFTLTQRLNIRAVNTGKNKQRKTCGLCALFATAKWLC
eukprot:12351-Heterococcus_DN1.PRE.2